MNDSETSDEIGMKPRVSSVIIAPGFYGRLCHGPQVWIGMSYQCTYSRIRGFSWSCKRLLQMNYPEALLQSPCSISTKSTFLSGLKVWWDSVAAKMSSSLEFSFTRNKSG